MLTHALIPLQPHSADLPLQGNAPARKLFHAIDDEGYHVPTHVSLEKKKPIVSQIEYWRKWILGGGREGLTATSKLLSPIY